MLSFFFLRATATRRRSLFGAIPPPEALVAATQAGHEQAQQPEKPIDTIFRPIYRRRGNLQTLKEI